MPVLPSFFALENRLDDAFELILRNLPRLQ